MEEDQKAHHIAGDKQGMKDVGDHLREDTNSWILYFGMTGHIRRGVAHFASKLQLFPQTGDRDIQLLAVFGHGAAGDVIALFLQELRQLFITERLFLALPFDEVAEDLIYFPG